MLYEKSLIVRSIVEGITEHCVEERKSTIADRIIEFIKRNPGRPSCERDIVNRISKLSQRNENESPLRLSDLIRKDFENIEPNQYDSQIVRIMDDDEYLELYREESKVNTQYKIEKSTCLTKDSIGPEDHVLKVKDKSRSPCQYEDYRVSDVPEEGKDKRFADSGLVTVSGAKRKNYLDGEANKKQKNIVTTSIADVSCELFVTKKLNKMYNYITEKADCVII